FDVQATQASSPAWLCLAITPAGPTGFQRHDKAGRYIADKRISLLSYSAADKLVEVNSKWGPIFVTAPDHLGMYGNEMGLEDPDLYLVHNPFRDLAETGSLNGQGMASDSLAGLCTGAFAWQVPALEPANAFTLDVYLPVDDYRGDDLLEFGAANPANLMA